MLLNRGAGSAMAVRLCYTNLVTLVDVDLKLFQLFRTYPKYPNVHAVDEDDMCGQCHKA